RIERSSRPAWWYAACEAAIGAWSVVLALLMGPTARSLLDVIGTEPAPGWQWAVAFCGTFLLLLGYEVVVVRVLSQVAANTVYTFALLLAVYLIGTALGAAAYDRLSTRWSICP